MLRKLLIAFGLFEIVRPQPVIDACERIGLENSDQAQLRPWAHWGARLEGVFVVWVLVRGRTSGGSAIIGALLAAAGVVLALLPRPMITLSQELVYENTDDLELRPWIVPAARLLGVCYLLIAALSWRQEPSEGAESTP